MNTFRKVGASLLATAIALTGSLALTTTASAAPGDTIYPDTIANQHVAIVGEPLDITFEQIIADCTTTSGDPCVPDSISFETLPVGATQVGNGFTVTPTAPGTLQYFFTLTDSTSGATSASSSGTIRVNEPALPEGSTLHGVSKTWTLGAGESLSLTREDFYEGCYWITPTDPHFEPLDCYYEVLFESTPDGAVLIGDKGNVVGIDSFIKEFQYTCVTNGTFELKYRLMNYDKSVQSELITSYIVANCSAVAGSGDSPTAPVKPQVTG